MKGLLIQVLFQRQFCLAVQLGETIPINWGLPLVIKKKDTNIKGFFPLYLSKFFHHPKVSRGMVRILLYLRGLVG